MWNVLCLLHNGEWTELIFLGVLAKDSPKVICAHKNVDFINVAHFTKTAF